MKVFFLILMALNLSACLKISDIPDDPEASDPIEVQRVPEPIGNPITEAPQVHELEGANQYQVIVPVPNSVQMVRRRIKGQEASEAFPADIQDGVLTDGKLEAGQTYIYELGLLKEGSFEALQSFEIKIPLDREILNEEILQQDENWVGYHRIFLGSGSTITTNGHHLIIQADQIQSRGGLIRTFPPGSQAPLGQDASPGASVQIRAQTAKGQLKFEMRGQQGGAGVDGASPPAEGGMGTATGHMCNPPPQTCHLITGLNGGDGASGGKGGSSGSVEIQIQEEHELDIEVSFEVGKGGKGGHAGKGQPPGGSVDREGQDGKPGRDGADAGTEKLCLQDLKGLHCLWQNGFLKAGE